MRATGKTLRTFEGNGRYAGNSSIMTVRLYLVMGDRMLFNAYGDKTDTRQKKTDKPKKKKKAKKENVGAPGIAFKGYGFPLSAYNRRTGNAEKPTSSIVAVNAGFRQGVMAVGQDSPLRGLHAGTEGRQTGLPDRIRCHLSQCSDPARKTGRLRSRSRTDMAERPNALVLTDTLVLSEEGKQLHAYALTDGSDSWGKSITVSQGYRASSDIHGGRRGPVDVRGRQGNAHQFRSENGKSDQEDSPDPVQTDGT